MATKIEAAYCRFSSEAQRDSTSITVQIEQCERAAGQSLVTYIDEAKTGRGMAGRENLHRLMADAAAGKISKLYVSRYDRLGRNEADTFTTVEELEDYGVEVLSASEGKDAITRGLMLVMAAHTSRELAVKTRNGLLQRHTERAFTGGVASYGYTVADHEGRRVLVINPEEAGVVQAIYDAYLGEEPMGFKAIAKMLNIRGIQTRSMTQAAAGKVHRDRIKRVRPPAPWAMTSVRAILLNPLYTGVVNYNRRTMKLDRATDRRVPKFNDESAVRTYTDPTLQIITPEQFAAAASKMTTRATGTGSSRSAKMIRAFTGHLFCQTCGSAFYSRKSENAKGTYIYYNCGCRQRRGPEACSNAIALREDHLLAGLQAVGEAVFHDVESLIEAITAEMGATTASNRTEADRIRGLIREVEGQISHFGRLFLNPDIAAEPMAFKMLVRQSGEAEKRRDDLQASLSKLLDKSSDDADSVADRIRRKVLDARDRWSSVANPAQMNRMIEVFVGPSLVSADGRLLPMQSPTVVTVGDVHGCIAGGGFEPPTSGL